MISQDIGDLAEALAGYRLISRDEIDMRQLVLQLRRLDILVSTFATDPSAYLHVPALQVVRTWGIVRREQDLVTLCERLGYHFQNVNWLSLIFVSDGLVIPISQLDAMIGLSSNVVAFFNLKEATLPNGRLRPQARGNPRNPARNGISVDQARDWHIMRSLGQTLLDIRKSASDYLSSNSANYLRLRPCVRDSHARGTKYAQR